MSSRGIRVAIVGSGCSGLAALWALKQTDHVVDLYEATERLGGHANTISWQHGGRSSKVDGGFIVMNEATYPNFLNFLREIKVDFVPTDMTFAVSRDLGEFEWAGTNLDTVFCQRRNLFSARMWRMLFDVVRFNQFALDIIIGAGDSGTASRGEKTEGIEQSIGEYLMQEGYSDAFRDDYLIPMTASVWSTGPDKCALDFPAATLVRFLWNHHLLSTIAVRPNWLTISQCSQAYIDAIMADFPIDHVFLNTPVRQVSNDDRGHVRLHLDNDRVEVYDHVILATHGDQSYSIIKDSATAQEHAIMSCFHTSRNSAVLHSDLSLMPKSRAAWSSWNYLTRSSAKQGTGVIDQVSLTYNMNILQHIPRDTFGDVLITLNPIHEPMPETVQGRYEYRHPLYTAEAVEAQNMLPSIQNTRGISFAGAWTKYGFHEDGFSSGLRAAQDHLGAKLPFPFKDSTYSRGQSPQLTLADWMARLLIMLIQVFVVLPIDSIMGAITRVSGSGDRLQLPIPEQPDLYKKRKKIA